MVQLHNRMPVILDPKTGAPSGGCRHRLPRHTLRHTAITHLVQAGVDLPTVKRISGHKTLAMVERYAHANGTNIQTAMDKLEGRLKLNSGPSRSGFFGQDYTGITHSGAEKTKDEMQVSNSYDGPCRIRTYDQRIKSPSFN